MAFKFYIDTFLTDQPDNGTDLITSIRRDSLLKGLVVTQDLEIKWSNYNDVAAGEISGYDYIKTKFEDSVCNELELVIYDEISDTETYRLYTGMIKLTQVAFDEHETFLSTKVQDNSYYALVHNNKELKVDTRAIQTKSKLPTTAIDQYSIDMFASATGIYGSLFGALYHAYRVYDLFEFIIRVITDNRVGFDSTYLSTLTYDLFITKGQELNNPYTLFPGAQTPVYEISFADLFNEINKAKNLYFYIDTNDPDAPILRIENTEASYTSSTIATLTDVKEIKTYTDTGKLYGQVTVGSKNTVDGVTVNIYTFDESTSYYGWKIEQFFPIGQCNTNQELNLVSDYVISNNSIQDATIGLSTDNQDGYFIIECDNVDTTALTAYAHRYDYFGQTTPPFFYNFGLNNYSKLQRHSDKFETAFGTFLGIGGLGFKALLGDSPLQDIVYVTAPASATNFIPINGITVDAEYVNETTQGGYDGSNNYSNVTFEYTVPQDGDYSFHHQLNFAIGGIIGSEYFDVVSYVTQYDSLMNVKSVGSAGNPASYTNNGLFLLDATLVCNAVAGDIIKGSYFIRYVPNQGPSQQLARSVRVAWESFLECNGTPEGGISITSGNKSIKKLLHEMTYDFTATEIRTILANPTGVVRFEKDGVTRYGWIEDMQILNQTGRSKLKLISQDATS